MRTRVAGAAEAPDLSVRATLAFAAGIPQLAMLTSDLESQLVALPFTKTIQLMVFGRACDPKRSFQISHLCDVVGTEKNNEKDTLRKFHDWKRDKSLLPNLECIALWGCLDVCSCSRILENKMGEPSFTTERSGSAQRHLAPALNAPVSQEFLTMRSQ